MARILLGVSGGIAAYKALEFVRLATGGRACGARGADAEQPALRRRGVVRRAERRAGAGRASSSATRCAARSPTSARRRTSRSSHLELVANADVFLIAPASANTIAKLARGLADNLLSSCALAADCPLVVAPAMNNHMYEHPATQAEPRRRCASAARTIVEPGDGRLASKGEEGVGRLAEPAELLAACERAIEDLDRTVRARAVSGRARQGGSRGCRVLVTAGGTREPIDSVRFVGNSSSGRMGLALARGRQRARRRGDADRGQRRAARAARRRAVARWRRPPS